MGRYWDAIGTLLGRYWDAAAKSPSGSLGQAFGLHSCSIAAASLTVPHTIEPAPSHPAHKTKDVHVTNAITLAIIQAIMILPLVLCVAAVLLMLLLLLLLM